MAAVGGGEKIGGVKNQSKAKNSWAREGMMKRCVWVGRGEGKQISKAMGAWRRGAWRGRAEGRDKQNGKGRGGAGEEKGMGIQGREGRKGGGMR